MGTGNKTMSRRQRRRKGIRKRGFGTAQRPRLAVYRSLKHIYAQIIDDLTGHTLVSASSAQAKLSNGCNKAGGGEVGAQLAQKAKAAGIQRVALDRSGFKYHGRIKTLADAAREGGLQF